MSLQSRNLKDTIGTEVTVAVEELAERGVRVDYVQVWRFVHARGLSYKKSVLPAEQLSSKIARRRAQWRKY